MPDHFDQCRLCSKNFEPYETRSFIEESIRTEFKYLTQNELIDASSKVLCDRCMSSLRMANAVKRQLSANKMKIMIPPTPKLNSSIQQSSMNDSSDDVDQDQINFTEHPKFMVENSFLKKKKPNANLAFSYTNSVPSFKRSPYQCFYCDKSYAERYSRKRHILLEHMKQSFTCVVDSCKAVYKTKYHLQRHVDREHRKLENYEDICNASLNLIPTFEVPHLKLND